MLNNLESYSELMDKCSNCAFCEATCPVFQADLLETHVARARMMIIRETLLKKNLPISDRTKEIIDRCLLCSNCKMTCPAAIPVNEIVIAARYQLYKGKRASLPRRMVMKQVMKKRGVPGIFKTAETVARAAGFSSTEIPQLSRKSFADLYPAGTYSPKGPVRARALYFVGCGTNMVYTDTGDAAMKVLLKNGVEVTIPDKIVCCGMPALGEGDLETARKLMETNISALAGSKAEVIVTDCTSCGLTFKEKLGQVIPETDPLHEKAIEVSSKIVEVTDYLDQIGMDPVPQKLGQSCTYHVPCHGNWSSSLKDAPRRILSDIKQAEVVEMDRPGACCGAGGAFFVDNRDLSRKIRAPKLEDIGQTGADIVITQCPSCRSYLNAGLENGQRVMHPITLIASAYGLL